MEWFLILNILIAQGNFEPCDYNRRPCEAQGNFEPSDYKYKGSMAIDGLVFGPTPSDFSR